MGAGPANPPSLTTDHPLAKAQDCSIKGFIEDKEQKYGEDGPQLTKCCNSALALTRRRQLFRWLYELGDAPTAESFQLRLQQLRASQLYLGNAQLQAYLQNEWLNCTESWAKHCRLTYHGGIDTNNHMEAMNRALKTKWFKHRPDLRMDSLLEMWVEEVLPHYAIEYARENTQSYL